MSDTHGAPAAPAAAPSAPAAAPAAPAAPANQVPINQSPVSTPTPTGAQAPSAPVGDTEGGKGRPPSRREAIKAAFDRAVAQQEAGEKPAPRAAARAPEAKPAEAKRGHNEPPEETETFNLKKRPTDQPRDRGRFAPRQSAEDVTAPRFAGEQPGQQPAQQPAQRPAAKQLPAHAPYPMPPARISERGKQDWADAPESIRADMHRMHTEFGKAYQFYRDDAAAFQPIKRFHQMAEQGGTTLEKALNNYISMEHKLRQDVVAGLDIIVSNLGLKTADGQPLGLRDIAYHVLSSTPEQLRQMQQGNQQQAAGQQIGQLMTEIQGLKQAMQEMHNQQRFSYTRSAVDQFADTHPRFDELGALINQEISLGFDLDTAYRRAELLQPAAHAPQTRTSPAQTRPVDRSISGFPDVASSNGASRKPKEPSRSPRDAIANAMKRVNGGF